MQSLVLWWICLLFSFWWLIIIAYVYNFRDTFKRNIFLGFHHKFKVLKSLSVKRCTFALVMYCRAEETVSLNIFFQLALNRITLVSIYPVCWSCPSHNSPCRWPMTCGTYWQTWIPKLKPNSWAPRQSSADSAQQAPSGSTRWGDEWSALRFHRLHAVVISVNWLCVASAGGQQGCVWDVRGSRSSGEDTGSRCSSATVFQPSVLLCRRRGTI